MQIVLQLPDTITTIDEALTWIHQHGFNYCHQHGIKNLSSYQPECLVISYDNDLPDRLTEALEKDLLIAAQVKLMESYLCGNSPRLSNDKTEIKL